MDDLRTLDISLAEKLFGIKAELSNGIPIYFPRDESDWFEDLPEYSSDAAAMLTVVEKMLELDWSLSCIAKPDQDPSLKFACIALKLEPVKLLVKYAPTLPLAVARAAIAALDSEGK